MNRNFFCFLNLYAGELLRAASCFFVAWFLI